MESSDDDGDTAAALAKTFSFFAFFILFSSCNKPPKPPSTSFTQAPVLAQPAVAKTALSRPVRKKSKRKKVYLTFDDGPNKGTRNVLHIVQDEQVPVTFFIVGEHVFASVGQGRMWDSLKMAREIELCNHSFTHAHNRYDAFYQQPDSVVKDFQRAHDSLGLENTIVRTPGRNIWRVDSISFTDLKKSTVAADSLRNAGFVVMGWDLEWTYDHKSLCANETADQMITKIDSAFSKKRTKVPEHLVLLAHDQVYAKSNDSFQLRQFIRLLKQRDDYELVLATDYPGADKRRDSLLVAQ
jgi:peptidoglycan-N-acetylglucosamine deacetylase